MRTKRFVVQIVMMAVLAAGTAGVMPAPGCQGSGCSSSQSAVTMPNFGTYGEQSSNGKFDAVWGEAVWVWFESVVLPIL